MYKIVIQKKFATKAISIFPTLNKATEQSKQENKFILPLIIRKTRYTFSIDVTYLAYNKKIAHFQNQNKIQIIGSD